MMNSVLHFFIIYCFFKCGCEAFSYIVRCKRLFLTIRSISEIMNFGLFLFFISAFFRFLHLSLCLSFFIRFFLFRFSLFTSFRNLNFLITLHKVCFFPSGIPSFYSAFFLYFSFSLISTFFVNLFLTSPFFKIHFLSSLFLYFHTLILNHTLPLSPSLPQSSSFLSTPDSFFSPVFFSFPDKPQYVYMNHIFMCA